MKKIFLVIAMLLLVVSCVIKPIKGYHITTYANILENGDTVLISTFSGEINQNPKKKFVKASDCIINNVVLSYALKDTIVSDKYVNLHRYPTLIYKKKIKMKNYNYYGNYN